MTAVLTSCFSYLASVHTLRVPELPRLNYGVEIISTERFLAGDGPIVAGALSALGHSVTLTTNPIGDDQDGHAIAQHLHRWGVNLAPHPLALDKTRTNVVICDDAGNRTWFSGLRGITDQLRQIDLGTIARAQAVYVDCYEVLADTPRPVVETALNTGADLYLNLGGSPPPPWLDTAMAGRQARVIQTNADEGNLDAATRLLDELFELRAADIAVVTAGRDGAIARATTGAVVSAPALAVTVRQVQGAGAVFSAALVDALHQGMELQPGLRTACVAGSLWCERTTEAPFPDRMQLADRMSQ